MNEYKVLLYIIRNFINNKKNDIKLEIDENRLYNIAKQNKMSNFLQKWSNECCKSEELKNIILSDYNNQIIKDTNVNIEYLNVINEFEKENINTIVLKGVVFKEIYPQSYMRQMCDIDLFINESDFKVANKIMQKFDFEKYYNHEKELIYKKDPFCIVEIHRKFMTATDVGYDYFENIWESCKKYKNYDNIYELNIQDAYIYCIFHLLIHFKFTGIGIRDILDVYLYNEKYKDTLDNEKIKKIFEKYNVEKFEKKLREISYKWFGNNYINEFDEIEKFILNGSNIGNMINYSVGANNGKANYIRELFFPSFKVMKGKYPILNNAPILLPMMWCARIFKDIFSKESTISERFNKLKLIQSAKVENVEHVKNIFEKLGIQEDIK